MVTTWDGTRVGGSWITATEGSGWSQGRRGAVSRRPSRAEQSGEGSPGCDRRDWGRWGALPKAAHGSGAWRAGPSSFMGWGKKTALSLSREGGMGPAAQAVLAKLLWAPWDGFSCHVCLWFLLPSPFPTQRRLVFFLNYPSIHGGSGPPSSAVPGLAGVGDTREPGNLLQCHPLRLKAPV